MPGIQWPDSVSSQAGSNAGRTSRPSSNAGTAPKPKVDGTLARSPSWPHAQRSGSPAAGGSSGLARSASGQGALFRAEDAKSPVSDDLGVPSGTSLTGSTYAGPGDAGSSAASGSRVAEKQPARSAAYPGSVGYLPEGIPDSQIDAGGGGGVPRPGRQAMDAVLRRPDGELTPTGRGALSEVSIPRSGAGDEGSRTRARLATVAEASPPATVEQVPPDGSATTGPELLDTERSPGPSTYSEARDSHTKSPMGRRSREGGDNSGDTRSNASRRRDKLRLPDFMVHMPAGSGCGTSDLPSNSTFVDVEKGSYILEAQGVVRPGAVPSTDTRSAELEAKMKALRSEYAEEIARERKQRQQQVQALEDKLRRSQLQAADEEARLKKELEKVSTGAVEAAEASMRQLRQELQSESAVAETAVRCKAEAEKSATELADAQRQRDEVKKKLASTRSAAAESERQRQALLKQSSTQVANGLREELETASKQNTEYVKKMKRMVPHVQRLQEEGERLRQQLSEQTEIAAANGRQVKTESQEMAKAHANYVRQKKSLQGQVSNLNTELDELKTKLKEAQGELTKEQRLRLDENRKQQNAKAEIKRLRGELENTETALQQQAASMAMTVPNQQVWAVDPRLAAVVNPRTGPSQLPRNMTPHGRSTSPPAMAPGYGTLRGLPPNALVAPVGSAAAVRPRVTPAVSGAAAVARSGWPAEMEAEMSQDMSTLQMAAEDSPGAVSPYSNSGMGPAEYAGAETGSMPHSPLAGYRDGMIAASNGTGGAPGSPIAGGFASPMSNMRVTNSASQRLFDVIEKAKERADARRLLTGAAEDVKVKAQALEELLANSENGL